MKRTVGDHIMPSTDALVRSGCDHAGGKTLTKEIVPEFVEESLGLPVVLVRAVEIKKCGICGCVVSKKIPDLQNLVAAMAVTRVMDPLKLGAGDIRFLRKALNWTGKALGTRLGVSVETVSRWENAKELIGIANERLFRVIVGLEMAESAPAIEYDAEKITTMKIQGARATDDLLPMCFERVKFKRPRHPKENQWDTADRADAA